VDLAAVKEAPTGVLAGAAAAAARNAHDLVEDADLLSRAGHLARAYSLAGLAVEEVGKASGMAYLATMPEKLRAQAPVGRMLEWHQMKLVAGEVVAVLFCAPGMAFRFVSRPLDEMGDVLDDAQAYAEDTDRLRQRGLYVDVDRSGNLREPSEVTADEVRDQLLRAQRAASAASPLLEASPPPWLADPTEAAVELSRALVSSFGEARHARSPEAAADVLRATAVALHG
jgi:AbiV family abortive infection protein